MREKQSAPSTPSVEGADGAEATEHREPVVDGVPGPEDVAEHKPERILGNDATAAHEKEVEGELSRDATTTTATSEQVHQPST